MIDNLFIIIGVLSLTIGIYITAKRINNLRPHPFTLPILLSSTALIFILYIFDIQYETYMIGGQWIDKLLGPAVVALAVPLYKQRKMLRNYAGSIAGGVITGSLIGAFSGFILAKLAGFEKEILFSITTKSITTPVAVSITEAGGGLPSLTAVFVIMAGIAGAILQPVLFDYLKWKHFLMRGVGMGTASHAIGTTRSIETSESEGAVSTVAMILSAVIVSIFVPIFFRFL